MKKAEKLTTASMLKGRKSFNLPGPLAPPAINLPNRKITARSYS
jgi:hypothetical protein